MTPTEVLAWLEQRACRDDATGCLIWTQACNNKGHPVATVDGKRARAVRPWLHRKLADAPFPGRRVLVASCGDLRCLNREHWTSLRPSQLNDMLVRQGRYNTPARYAANVRNGRRCSSYTPEQIDLARALRAAGHTLAEVSSRTGIGLSSASRICRGERHRATMPAASVFCWGART